ncbi:MAG: alpha/beta hydrolase [Elainellaceae cyanobacterium]
MVLFSTWRRRWLGSALVLMLLTLAWPARAAERIFLYFSILERSIDISSLEAFAEDGTVNRQLSGYFSLAGVDEAEHAELRRVLQEPAPIEPDLLSRILYTNIGEEILHNFGKLLRTEAGVNGEYALRAALLLAVAEDDLSLLNFLRHLPLDMRVNLQSVLELTQSVGDVADATRFAIEKLEDLSDEEAGKDVAVDYAGLPQLDQRGDYGVRSLRWSLTSERQNLQSGEPYPREFYVNVVHPAQWRPGKTPVIVLSHGLASRPEYFAGLAAHMASYGYVVAMPQHPGSDVNYQNDLIKGLTNTLFDLGEFIDRPQDISAVIDELERRNDSEFGGRLDLEHVGVGGHSFGGYTALAVAGATIDFKNLETECGDRFGYLNTSLLLQCQARELPRQAYTFRDERVQSVLVMNPVNSSIYGREGLSQVQIPALVLSGSHDPATPAVFEQFRTFPWLGSQERYLGLIEGHAHIDFSVIDPGITDTINSINGLTLAESEIIETYSQGFSLAFFGVHAAQDEDYRRYLQASYSDFLSREQRSPLHLISDATNPELESVIEDFLADGLLD